MHEDNALGYFGVRCMGITRKPMGARTAGINPFPRESGSFRRGFFFFFTCRIDAGYLDCLTRLLPCRREFLCARSNPIEVARHPTGRARQSNLQRQYLRDTSRVAVSPGLVCVCFTGIPEGESVPRPCVEAARVRLRATLDVSLDSSLRAERASMRGKE